MDLQLSGKRALVTGSSMGIGEAIARALSAEGVTVVVHGMEQELVDKLVGELDGTGSGASGVTGDLSSDEEAARVAREAAAIGGIDILVNNAGILTPAAWMEATPEMWQQIYNVNVLGAVRLIHELVPAMRAAGGDG
jgi:3-oxoacyl-[acyl-carrier protein] reductase